MVDIEQIQKTLQEKLKSQIINGRVLLNQMRLLDEASRHTAAYLDSKYVSFYYHLGNLIQPKSLLEVGFNLGLLGGCFLKANKTVERYCGFQQQTSEYYSTRLGLSNIRSNYKKTLTVHVGTLSDEQFFEKISPNSWDLIIINEESSFDRHLLCFDLLWPSLATNGIMAVESVIRHTPMRDAFDSFCASVNRKAIVFDTRYGTGLIQK